ncbi:unnamed protein product, partial [Phaeothamnion confervicola]
VTAVTPTEGFAFGGATLTVRGSGFVFSSVVKVRIGAAEVPASYVSLTELRCTAPPLRPAAGVYALELSPNGQDMTTDGVLFVYRAVPAALRLTPASGPRTGGTPVMLSGLDIPDGVALRCRFGAAAPSAARRLSAKGAVCTAPGAAETAAASDGISAAANEPAAATGAAVTFELSAADGSLTAAGALSFWYYGDVAVAAVVPSAGPLTGGTEVIVYGDGFAFSPLLRVRFGRAEVAATFVSATELRCRAPSALAAARSGIAAVAVTVAVSVNGIDFSAVITGGSNVTYRFLSAPTVTSSAPAYGPVAGGTIVTLFGSGFSPTAQDGSQALCLFRSVAGSAKRAQGGSADGGNVSVSVSATVVSDSELRCIAPPAAAPSVFRLTAAPNGEDAASGSAAFRYVAPTIATAVMPTSGPVSGGTSVVIVGADFPDLAALGCRFHFYIGGGGDGGLSGAAAVDVAARWLSAELMHCMAPVALAVGAAAVSVTLDGEALGGDTVAAALPFMYFVAPAVTSVSPRGGGVEGGNEVTIRGAGFALTAHLAVRFGHVVVPATFIGPGELRCVAPPAPRGEVTVSVTLNGVDFTVADGNGGDSSSDSGGGVVIYMYRRAAQLVSVLPTVGPMTGGTAVVIAGAGFSEADGGITCRFWMTAAAAAVSTAATAISDTELRCITPPAAASGSIYLDAALEGESFAASSIAFRYFSEPTVLALRPAAGPASGGTVVSVEGANFLDGVEAQCRFGVAVVSARWLSPSRLQCQAPPAAAAAATTSSGDVTEGEAATEGELVAFELVLAGVAYGSSGTAMMFEYQPDARIVAAATPRAGSTDGGTNITLVGVGFAPSPALRVRFGLAEVPATFISATRLWCLAPPAAAALTAGGAEGPVSVGISNNGVDFGTASPDAFVYRRAPFVTSVTPTRGAAAGGTIVVVRGINFATADDDGGGDGPLLCRFGSAVVSGVRLSGAAVRCAAPAAAALGPVAVELSLNGVDFTANRVRFVYAVEPEIMAVWPAAGPASGGTVVTVRGAHFSPTAGLRCYFCGSDDVNSGNSAVLQCAVPPAAAATTVVATAAAGAGSAGAAVAVTSVAVSNNGADFTAALSHAYAYHAPAAAVTALDPPRAPPAGGVEVAVRGAGFSTLGFGRPGCRFGGAGDVAALLVSDAELRCKAPPVAAAAAAAAAAGGSFGGSVGFELLVDGVAFLPKGVHFAYVAGAPAVAAISPPAGPAGGGTVVSVHGANLVNSEQLACRFGGAGGGAGSVRAVVAARWISAALIKCEAPPAGAAGGRVGESVAVAVTSDGQSYYGASDGATAASFRYLPDAQVATVLPASASPGSVVIIRGTGFAYSAGLTVRFGTATVPAVFINATELRCTVPPPSPPAQVAASSSVVAVAVSNNGVDFGTATVRFEFRRAARVTSAFPTEGSAAGGTVVTIRGAGFESVGGISAPSATCRFGTAPGVTAVVISDVELLCASPQLTENNSSAAVAAAAMTVKLAVVLDGAAVPGSDDIAFTFLQWPTVTAVEPRRGASGGGAAVLVSGSGFARGDRLECLFGSAATPAVRLSLELLSCIAPPASAAAEAAADAGAGNAATVALAVAINGVRPASSSSGEDGSVTFTYAAAVTVASLQPSRGPDTGGTLVTVRGEARFREGAQWFCWFGRQRVPAMRTAGGTALACVTPPLAGRDTAVILAVSSGDDPPFAAVSAASKAAAVFTFIPGVMIVAAGAGAVAFRYFEVPVVTGILPAFSTAGGATAVTVTGAGFLSSSTLACRFVLASAAAAAAAAAAGGRGSPSSREAISICPAPTLMPGRYRFYVSNNMADFIDSGLHFELAPPPTLAAVTPASASPHGGTTLLITGANFALSRQLLCIVGGRPVVATVLDDHRAACAAPPHEPGAAEFQICDGKAAGTSGSGTSGSSNLGGSGDVSVGEILVTSDAASCAALSGEVVPAPLAAASPACRFGAQIVPAVVARVVSATATAATTTFSCRVPPHAPGEVALSLSCNGVDFGAAVPFTFLARPRVLSTAPAVITSGGGAHVSLYGVGFGGGTWAAAGGLHCHFGPVLSAAAGFYSARGTTAAWLRVGGPGSDGVGFSDGLLSEPIVVTYVAMPLLAAAAAASFQHAPAWGLVGGGSAVTVTGPHAGDGGANSTVAALYRRRCKFGATAVVAMPIGPSQALCVAPPASATGSVILSFSLDGINYWKLAEPFTYCQPLVLRSLEPAVVDASPTAFVGATAAAVNALSSSATGTGPNVTLWFGGDDAADALVEWTSLAAGAAAALTAEPAATEEGKPASGLLCHFRRGGVVFGSSPASMVPGAAAVSCAAPPSAPGAVTVSLWAGEVRVSLGGALLRYVAAPTVIRVRPSRGFARGGGVVTVEGIGFIDGGDLVCRFDSAVGAVSGGGGGGGGGDSDVASSLSLARWLSEHAVECTVPPGIPGAATVTVRNAGSRLGSGSGGDPNGAGAVGAAFQYLFNPSMTATQPAAVTAAGGTVLTLVGQHFPMVSDLACVFGGEPAATAVTSADTNVSALAAATVAATFTATPASIINATHLQCAAPALTAGAAVLVRLRALGKLFAAGDGITLTVAAGDDSLRLLGASPGSGPATGGTTLVLSTAGVPPAAEFRCRFDSGGFGDRNGIHGGNSGMETAGRWLSAEAVVCLTPAWMRPEETVSVALIIDGIVAQTSGAVTFRYRRPILVVGVAPGAVSELGETTVAVRGLGFADGAGLACAFDRGGNGVANETAAVIVAGRFISTTEVRCVVPPMAPGLARVAVALNGKDFVWAPPSGALVVFPQPTVAGVRPSCGTVVGGTAVTSGSSGGGGGIRSNSGIMAFCLFGSSAVPAAVLSANELTCVAPLALQAGNVTLAVSLSGAYSNGNGGDSNGVVFEYIAGRASDDVVAVSVLPRVGDQRGGTTLVLSDVAVFTAFAHSSLECRFSAVATSAAPAEGSGEESTVLDTAVTMATVVTAPTADAQANDVTCTTPAFAMSGLYQLTVVATVMQTTADGTGTGWSAVLARGGLRVVISGRGFAADSDMCCRFGGATVPARLLTPSAVECTAPPAPVAAAAAAAIGGGTSAAAMSGDRSATGRGAALGKVPVEVSHNCRDFYGGTSAVSFQYLPIITAVGIWPSSGPAAGGTAVTVATSGDDAIFGPAEQAGGGSFPPLIPARQTGPSTAACKTPQHAAGTVSVRLVDLAEAGESGGFPEADDASAVVFTFVADAPFVTALVPSAGPIGGGTMLTLSGFAAPAALCRFSAANREPITVAAIAAAANGTWLQCHAPAWPSRSDGSGSGVMTVEASANGADFSTNGHVFSYYERPVLVTVSPAVVSDRGDGELRITGIDFPSEVMTATCGFFPFRGGGRSNENFGGWTSRAVWTQASELRCKVPPMSPGLVEVKLSFNEQDYNAAQPLLVVRVVPHPTVFRVDPPVGYAGGSAAVAVDGTGFWVGANTKCRFGSMPPTPATVLSASRLLCAAPPLPGGAQAAAQAVDVTAELDGVPAVPAAGAVPIRFQYLPTPVALGVVPDSGGTAGGTEVTVVGSNFAEGFGVQCRFGDAGAVSASFVDSDALLCRAPPHHEGEVVVTVSTDGGRSFSPAAAGGIVVIGYGARFRYASEPPASLLEPWPDPYDGSNNAIAVFGSGFVNSPDLTCRYGGNVATPAVWISSTQVRCALPSAAAAAAAGLGDGGGPTSVAAAFAAGGGLSVVVSAANSGQDFSSENASFVYRSPAKAISLLPEHGPARGGTPVTVIGANFGGGFTAVTGLECRFGRQNVPAAVINDSHLMCVSPLADAGLGIVDVTLVVGGGGGEDWTASQAVANLTFQYVSLPRVTALKPQLLIVAPGATVNGTSVTVRGEGFLPSPLLRCRLSGETLPATFVSASEISCSVAADVARRLAASSVSKRLTLEVTTNGNDFSEDGRAMAFAPSPLLTGLSPAAGSTNGGMRLVFTGLRFFNSPSIACRIGNATVPARRISDTAIACTSPAAPPSRVAAAVTLNGRDFSYGRGAPLVFEYLEPPAVESVQPVGGPVWAVTATLVTLRGVRFRPTASLTCHFGKLGFSGGRYINETAIQCLAPEAADPGAVTVAVSLDGEDVGASLATFTYINCATVASLAPAAGAAGGGAVVTVKGGGFWEALSPTCYFGGVPAAATRVVADDTARWLSSSLLRCVVPPALLATGAGQLRVSVAADGAFEAVSESSALLTVAPPRTLLGIAPRHGSTLGGTLISLHWTGAGAVANAAPVAANAGYGSGAVCRFGGYLTVPAVAMTVLSGVGCPAKVADGRGACRRVECLTPPRAAGVTAVELSLEGGRFFGGGSRPVNYTFAAPAVALEVAPKSGPASGGTAIHLAAVTADGMVGTPPLPLYSSADLNDTAAASLRTITCVTPAWAAAGPGDVLVLLSTNGGADFGRGGPIFTYYTDPIVMDVLPTVISEAEEGGATTLTVTGLGMTASPALACVFLFGEGGYGNDNGSYDGILLATTTASAASPFAVTCAAPALRRRERLWVGITVNGADAHGFVPLTVEPRATIIDAWPDRGPASGGTVVVVSGADFRSSVGLVCRFGGTDVPAAFVSSNTVRCVAPPYGGGGGGGAGAVALRVLDAGGGIGSSGCSGGDCSNAAGLATFSYLPTFTMLKATPTWGWTVGGTAVNVTVTGLGPYISAELNPKLTCVFGDREVDATVIDAAGGIIACITPPQSDVVAFADGVSGEVVLLTLRFGGTPVAPGSAVTFAYAPATAVTRALPSHGSELGGTVILVSGVNFANIYGGLSCRFGDLGVAASAATSTGGVGDAVSAAVAGNLVRCVAPPHRPGVVAVTVVTGGRLKAWQSTATFAFVGPIAVTGVSPGSGRRGGGTVVAVTGRGFLATGKLACRFGGVAVSARFVSTTAVECVTPPHDVGAATVEISTNGVDFAGSDSGNGVGTSRNDSVLFTYRPAMAVTAVVPADGTAAGGTLLAISGAGFFLEGSDLSINAQVSAGSLLCHFGTGALEVTALATAVSDGLASCTTPPAVTTALGGWGLRRFGALSVEISRNGEDRTADGILFRYVPEPLALALSPTAGEAEGGTEVFVTGANFYPSTALSCRFTSTSSGGGEGGSSFTAIESEKPVVVTSPARFVSPSEVLCVAPRRMASPGEPVAVAVAVTGNGVDFTTPPLPFLYLPPAVILSVEPAMGAVTGGTLLLVTGRGFRRGGALCRLGGAAAVPAVVLSDTALRCVAPPQPPGTVDLELLAPGAGGSGGNSTGGGSDGPGAYATAEAAFTYVTAPSIVAVTPEMVSGEESGNVIYVTTRNFNVPAGSGAVCRYGLPDSDRGSRAAMAMTPGTVDGNGVVACPTPPFSSELYGRGGLTLVEVAAVMPAKAAGVAAGVAVGAATASAAAATSSANGPLFPPAPQDLDMTDSGARLRHIPLSTVFEVRPAAAPSAGGTLVAVSGANFSDTAELACSFGGALVPAAYISAEALRCRTPRHAPAVVVLEVTADGRRMSNAGPRFVFWADPTVAFLTPDHGPPGGRTAVTVTGSNLAPPLFVGPDGRLMPGGERTGFDPRGGGAGSGFSGLVCRFGGIVVPALLPESGGGGGGGVLANEAVCLSPPLRPGAPAAVTVEVSVDNATFSSGLARFRYDRLVDVLALDPPAGGAGTAVVVTGTNFLPGPGLRCRFGDVVAAAPAVLLSAGELLCVAPPRTAAPAAVAVEVSVNGADFSFSDVRFDYLGPAAPAALWPVLGAARRGGTVVTVFGAGFVRSAALACEFGGLPSRAVSWVSPTAVLCEAPPHDAPGVVNVAVSNNGVDFAGALRFRYVAEPSVTDVLPRQVPAAGQVPVWVSGANFLNSTMLACRFGAVRVPAVFLSPTALVCLAPSHAAQPRLHRTLDSFGVEITLNSLDFTDSGRTVTYVAGASPGSYVHYGSNGGYDSYSSSSAGGAVNFTVCEPGTFQPAAGAVRCLSCPVGFICPDFGMTASVLCPAGSVCDALGLAWPAVPCPPGHICTAGTKTARVNAMLFVEKAAYNALDAAGSLSMSSSFSFFNDFDDCGKRTRRRLAAGVVAAMTAGNGSAYAWKEDPETGVLTFAPVTSAAAWVDHPRDWPGTGDDRWEHLSTETAAGMVTEATAEQPVACPLGHYCGAGVASAAPVPRNFSTPQRCYDGFFCPRGSTSPEGAGPCPPGYFCPTAVDAVPCPAGHHCPGIANTRPLECYPGTYQPVAARPDCTLCAAGEICPGWGRSLPEPCPAGFVCASEGLSAPVQLCPPGYFCDEGTVTVDPDDPDADGGPGRRRPQACPAGTFCLGGVAHNLTTDWIAQQPEGITAPQTCYEGTYCQEASASPAGSGHCFAGHYCPPGISYPVEAPIGNYNPKEGSVVPMLCFPGTYTPLRGTTECAVCPAGYTCLSYGTYEPSICPPGYYRSLADSVTCRSCPVGTFSPESGLTDISLCEPCPAGRVCGMQAMTGLADSRVCPAGYNCGVGTDRTDQFTHKCPAGAYCDDATTPALQVGLTCAAGYYCTRGTPNYLSTQNKCPVGYYCPAGTAAGSGTDLRCPRRTSAVAGSEELQDCAIDPISVCDKEDVDSNDPYVDASYYPQFSYTLLDGSGTVTAFDSTTTKNPTGEVQVVEKVVPVNASASATPWVNDTVEVFRTCPS